jgi:membrane-bound inhibitor of C-type lysozyme
MFTRKFSISRKATRFLAAGIAAVVIGGGAVGIVNATSSGGSGNAVAATSPSATLGPHVPGGRGSNARSGPAAGGSSGTVDSVSDSRFTLTTSAGQKVTVSEASSTTYQNGTTSSSASAITKGEHVLVLGTTDGTTITASQVTMQPAESGSTSSSSAGVVPFQRGAQSTSKQVGQIPANYSQGSGTIVSGKAANKATEAALTAYPGGVVDRVVKLSNGEYEVHNIGVNWPHHIFVSQDFEVLGAD